MTSCLLSLPQELFDSLIHYLRKEHARKLLEASNLVYKKGIDAFDKEYFRILPAELSCEGLHNTEEILNDANALYIRTICFKASWRRYRDSFEEIHSRLDSILTKALRASPRFKTITYYQDPNTLSNGCTNALILSILAGTVEEISTRQNRSIKVRLENLNPQDLDLLDDWTTFLGLVYCIKLRITDEDSIGRVLIRKIRTPLSLLSSLKELFISINDDRLLYQTTVSDIMASLHSRELESLTIKGFFASYETVKKILQPFQTSLKKLILKRAHIEDSSLVELIDYIRDHFSLDYVHFSDIGQEEYPRLIHEARFCGGNIKAGLDILKSDVLDKLAH